MAATFSRLLFAVAESTPAEPVLFLPLAGERDSVPVKVANVAVETGQADAGRRADDAGGADGALQRIRAPQGNEAQASGN